MEQFPGSRRLERETLSPAQRVIRHYFSVCKPAEHVVRFGNEDKTNAEMHDLKQSLPEHIHGMSVLADIILDADPTAYALDRARIHELIRYHDAHEAATGDEVYKTEDTRAKEQRVEDEIARLDALRGKTDTAALFTEYRTQTSPEAIFVKGIDRLEAYLSMIYANRTEKFINRSSDAMLIAERTSGVSELLADTSRLVVRFLQRAEGAQLGFQF